MPILRSLLPILILLLMCAPARAEPARDWTATVTLTAEGAHVIGNPAAKTRLVEYISYTCSGCAYFVAQATAPLKRDWVSKGTVAIEIRNLIRDRYDLAAALLTRCGGPARFPERHEAAFAAFPSWIQNVSAHHLAMPEPPAGMTQTGVLTDIAEKTGLLAMMAKHGVTPAQGKACIADAAARDRILAMTKKGAERYRIESTPSFLINGVFRHVHDWAGLRPLLPAPGN